MPASIDHEQLEGLRLVDKVHAMGHNPYSQNLNREDALQVPKLNYTETYNACLKARGRPAKIQKPSHINLIE